MGLFPLYNLLFSKYGMKNQICGGKTGTAKAVAGAVPLMYIFMSIISYALIAYLIFFQLLISAFDIKVEMNKVICSFCFPFYDHLL